MNLVAAPLHPLFGARITAQTHPLHPITVIVPVAADRSV
jgi:tripartite-type tricarboxylate transporter receptor subunit TctC